MDYEQFITHQPIEWKLFKDNLSFSSNNFRHALRISIATLAGYIISLFFPFGHGYWILLTIIVILKPAYSLTKKRNYERLVGTVLGAAIGVLILYGVHDNQVLFVIMLLLMIGTYSLMRTNYMISVIFMTPYILLLFQLLNAGNFKALIIDRVTDTGIGSVIAFLANLVLLPAWEHEQVTQYMLDAVKSNIAYFKTIAGAFIGQPASNTAYKVSRKNAFVALANLSDAFSRMLSEPKSKQKNSAAVHQFVVLNHMLTSHIATLSYYVKPLANKLSSADFEPLIQDTETKLEAAAAFMEGVDIPANARDTDEQNRVQQRLQSLLQARRRELHQGIEKSEVRSALSEFKPVADQFSFIDHIAADLRKAGQDWAKE